MLKYSHKQPFSFICYIVELIVEKLKFLHVTRFVSFVSLHEDRIV